MLTDFYDESNFKGWLKQEIFKKLINDLAGKNETLRRPKIREIRNPERWARQETAFTLERIAKLCEPSHGLTEMKNIRINPIPQPTQAGDSQKTQPPPSRTSLDL